MMLLVERIRLLAPTLAQAAEPIPQAHRTALHDSDVEADRGRDPASIIDAMIVPTAELAQLHDKLTSEFRRTFDLT